MHGIIRCYKYEYVYDRIITVIDAVLNDEKKNIIEKCLKLFRTDFFIEGPKRKIIF
jgi:hypothetical protein